jgi:hypothetical protein
MCRLFRCDQQTPSKGYSLRLVATIHAKEVLREMEGTSPEHFRKRREGIRRRDQNATCMRVATASIVAPMSPVLTALTCFSMSVWR